MDVATTSTAVGVRELKNNLSRYLERVKTGEEIVVTDHGRPVARLSAIDPAEDRLSMLISTGLVTPPRSTVRQRPGSRIKAKGSVSSFVAEQRR